MALRIYTDIVALARRTKPVLDTIAKHDAEHARQGRDAMMSAGLNVAEGQQQRGGHGRQRFQTAMGSADEVAAVLELAGAVGYVPEQPELVAEWRRVARTLYKLMTR